MERPEIEILDRALSTTRAVRRRLDLERDVPISVVLECLRPVEQVTHIDTWGRRQTSE